jgi:translation elongation factor EF-1alpha
LCGYHPKKDIAYVPISGLYGDNIKNPVDHTKIWCALLQCRAALIVSLDQQCWGRSFAWLCLRDILVTSVLVKFCINIAAHRLQQACSNDQSLRSMMVHSLQQAHNIALLRSPWYTGPTLFEQLDATEVPPRDPLAPFRMAVIDKFKDLGTVVMGKSESGAVRKGDTLLLMPNRWLSCQAMQH